MQDRIEVKKIGTLYLIAIFLATALPSCAAQAVATEQHASPTIQQTQGSVVHRSAQSITSTEIRGQSAPKADPSFTGCIDCPTPTAIPTLPQWFAIAMGLVLIGLSLFRMRRSKASTIA